MAGPLAGVGQSAPQVSSFQQTNANQNGAAGQVRENEQRQPRPNDVTAQNVQAAQAQTSETGNQDVLQRDITSALDIGQSFGPDSDAPRGSVLDIQV